MRILHTSDVHIGKKVNNFDLLEDQKYVLSQIIDRFKCEDIDALLISGDLYDSSRPSADAVGCVDWFLSELAGAKKPVLIVAGNHDSPERVAYASNLLANEKIYVSPVYDKKVGKIELEDEAGPVDFWLIPFVKPAHVRDFYPDKKISTYTDALECVVEDLDFDSSHRNVALVHQFVVSGVKNPETSESESVTLGALECVDTSVFDKFDYVALGHIHKPQAMGRPSCRYSGSILKYSFSEAKFNKSACIVDLDEDGEVAVELFALNPLHDMREIKGKIKDLIKDEFVENQVTDDYLHITLTDDMASQQDIATLRRLYPNIMALDYDNARTQAQGLENNYANIDSDKTALDHFKDFYEMQVGSSLNEEQVLLVANELKRVLEG